MPRVQCTDRQRWLALARRGALHSVTGGIDAGPEVLEVVEEDVPAHRLRWALGLTPRVAGDGEGKE